MSGPTQQVPAIGQDPAPAAIPPSPPEPGPAARKPPLWLRVLGRWRLRHKLAVSLSVAALLPVAVASWVAVSIVLRGLDSGLQQQVDRQLAVGLNLVLRQVQRLGDDAVRLASSAAVSSAMQTGPTDILEALARERPQLPASMVQIADSRGHVVVEDVIGGAEHRFAGLAIPDRADLIRAGLAYERRVTIAAAAGGLAVRAVAPIVDRSYQLVGVAVLSLPLDCDFADGIKGALGTDVIFYAGTAGAQSTFLDRFGARTQALDLSDDVRGRLRIGRRVLARQQIQEREYAVGYTTIADLAGNPVGVFAVAVDRAPLFAARSAALKSLALGAAGAFVFALGLSSLLSRRLTRPIGRLHEGAVAISRGDLDYTIQVEEGDEIGDLATAFRHMTVALKTNQERLAARMRELVALHDAGRAVSSILSVDQVLRKIVDSVARVLDVRLCALWLVSADSSGPGQGDREPTLKLGAARAKHSDLRRTLHGDEGGKLAAPLCSVATEVALARATLRVDRVAVDERRRDVATRAGVTGSLVATPLERKGSVVGVIIVGRAEEARAFSEADSNLLATFADQAATSIENARLYEEVRAFSEELEEKVKLRTTELESINKELGKTIRELQETQAQLILSERLAGLGQLVAGVAHEINSPSAAIRGSVDTQVQNVRRLTELLAAVSAMPIDDERRARFLLVVAREAPKLAARRVTAPAVVRRTARELRAHLESLGVGADAAAPAARALAEIDSADVEEELFGLLPDVEVNVVVGYLKEMVYLHRNAETIHSAIRRIQRIVGALKSYSHLDQAATRTSTDLHEGIENTLALLDHELGHGINVVRRYGTLPPVAVYVDELNQVWTNLIHNAVQALGGEGTITVETEALRSEVVVAIVDDGEGIPDDVLPRVFDPFFTTKAQGEGTGLGLGIARNIVERHDGVISATSTQGETRFEVRLPLVSTHDGTESPDPDNPDNPDNPDDAVASEPVSPEGDTPEDAAP